MAARAVILAFGALFLREGAVGLLDPSQFAALVVWLQSPPVWPGSVGLRALVGLALIGLAARTRCPGLVRLVGALTLAGAALGLVVTDPAAHLSGAVWRLPAAMLALAGALLLVAAGRPPARR